LNLGGHQGQQAEPTQNQINGEAPEIIANGEDAQEEEYYYDEEDEYGAEGEEA